ncbi:MAG: aminoacetone oxidase family FAD-binding enzyme, partial [Dehalococcoidia bacterium]
MPTYDAIVVGGGAAGLFCAIHAGRRGRRVLVLERSARVGRKILISGGGRCNFTNVHAAPDRYLSENPRFCVSALSRYTPQDFISLVEHHGIAYHEKELGQLFCDGTSQQIVDMLLAECQEAGVEVLTACDIAGVGSEASDYSLKTSLGTFNADALVMASGGLSIPKMGSTGFSHDVAHQFGLAVTEVRAGLVPFTFRQST